MSKKNKKDYDSTTNDPSKPEKKREVPIEDPDKTKKKEISDPTRGPDPDITSQPGNIKPKKESSTDDDEDQI